MGFRMTDSPFPRTSPNALDTDVDGFPFPSASTTRAAHFNVRLAIQDGGRDRRLWLSCASASLVQRVRSRTFGYPRHAPSLTASDGLALFVPISFAWLRCFLEEPA